MPCLDYEDIRTGNYNSNRVTELENQNDRLARIACDAMTRLTELAGLTHTTFVVNHETIEWWTYHQANDRAEQARLAKEREAEKKAKEAADRRFKAIRSLTKEQREALGV